MFTAAYEKWKNFGGNVNIYDDLTPDDVQEILAVPDLHSIQFYEFRRPKNETFKILNDLLFAIRPEIGLTLHWDGPLNWSFLDHVPDVKSLNIKSFMTKDFSPLRRKNDLRQLLIGETKSSAIDVEFISEFSELEVLSFDGMKKNISKIESLRNIKSLNLRGVKLKDLDFISAFKKLKLIKLMFGHYDDLSVLKSMPELVYIGLSRVRGIENYDFLVDQRALEFLHFEAMSRIESLPSLTGTSNLKKVYVDNMSRLNDLSALKEATELEEFVITFPENVNRQVAKSLLTQAVDILSTLPNIRRTNVFWWSDLIDTNVLKAKGVTEYDTRDSKWTYNREGGWSL